MLARVAIGKRRHVQKVQVGDSLVRDRMSQPRTCLLSGRLSEGDLDGKGLPGNTLTCQYRLAEDYFKSMTQKTRSNCRALGAIPAGRALSNPIHFRTPLPDSPNTAQSDFSVSGLPELLLWQG